MRRNRKRREGRWQRRKKCACGRKEEIRWEGKVSSVQEGKCRVQEKEPLACSVGAEELHGGKYRKLEGSVGNQSVMNVTAGAKINKRRANI